MVHRGLDSTDMEESISLKANNKRSAICYLKTTYSSVQKSGTIFFSSFISRINADWWLTALLNG